MNTTGQNKYSYLKVIQQQYGQGWEDVSEYETNSQGYPKELTTTVNKRAKKGFLTLLAHDLIEYRLTSYATRVVRRKELNKL